MTTNAQPFGLDRASAAAHLGISVSAFDRLVASGVLPPARKLGASRRWVRSELEHALIEAPADQPASAARLAEAADAGAGGAWDQALRARGMQA